MRAREHCYSSCKNSGALLLIMQELMQELGSTVGKRRSVLREMAAPEERKDVSDSLPQATKGFRKWPRNRFELLSRSISSDEENYFSLKKAVLRFFPIFMMWIIHNIEHVKSEFIVCFSLPGGHSPIWRVSFYFTPVSRNKKLKSADVTSFSGRNFVL